MRLCLPPCGWERTKVEEFSRTSAVTKRKIRIFMRDFYCVLYIDFFNPRWREFRYFYEPRPKLAFNASEPDPKIGASAFRRTFSFPASPAACTTKV